MEMVEWIKEAISGFYAEALEEGNSAIFLVNIDLLKASIIEPTDPGKYLSNFDSLLGISTSLAGALFTVFIILSVFRQLSGVLYQGEKSLGQYVLDITIAGGLIFLLPQIVTKIFLPLNNKLIDLLSGKNIAMENIDGMMNEWRGLAFLEEGFTILFLGFIVAISFFILAIAGAIRYVETIIIILVAPLFALSLINNSDGIHIWFREAISVIFTQTIHFLMLILMASIASGVSNTYFAVILTLGAVSVALKGPQILRQFLYRTGTSSLMVSGAGDMTRLGAMTMLVRR
jgi:hypothetical protein